MSDKLLTIEGIIVNTDGQKRGRIEIDLSSGLIVKVSEPTGNADVMLQDELIFPGFVDIHVHARECADHSQDYKEDFKTVGEAAINGGVVAIAEMPNNPVPPVDDASYEKKKELAEKCPVPVVLYAGIGPSTKPLSLGRSPMGEAKNVPYKAFMGPSVGELFFNSKDELEKTIKLYEIQNISFHCEDPEILEENKNQTMHELRRPEKAEISAVDFALYLIEKYKIIGKICHCSTISGLEKIIAAQKKGVNISVEITPHHLYFSSQNGDAGKMLQVNPPIRSNEEDRLALISMLKNGKIDFLATDHAPHTIEEKEKGMSGMPHLDTYGPFAAWLVKEHNFTPEEIARVCSYNPGKFISQFSEGKYGEIKEGYIGSLSIVDMKKPITIKKEILKTKCKWSPFEGVTFPGSVVMTIIKGKIYLSRTNF